MLMKKTLLQKVGVCSLSFRFHRTIYCVSVWPGQVVGGWPASLVDAAQREQEGRDTNTEPEVPSDAGLWLCYSATGIRARSYRLNCASKCMERLVGN